MIPGEAPPKVPIEFFREGPRHVAQGWTWQVPIRQSLFPSAHGVFASLRIPLAQDQGW